MKKSSLIFLILAILISSLGILPLLHPGFFLTDDGNSMVIRFSAFYEALRSGQFPVRFLSRLNFGFGYPVPDFLYPLFMYIGSPIHILGFSFVDTVKIILGGSLLTGTIFSFLWLRKLFDDKSAFIGSIAYSLFPYHLYDIYKRGSVGEVLALGIVPFVLWSIEKRSIFLISIGYGLLVMAHNSLALLFTPVIFIYHLLKEKSPKVLIPLVLGFSLSAFFSIPALYDKQFTIFDQTQVSNYKDYFVSSTSIELAGLVFFASIIFAFVYLIRRNKFLNLFLILGLFSFFLTLDVSDQVWRIFPLGSLVQFPFRFLSLAILCGSYLLAFESFHFKGKMRNLFFIFLFTLIISSAKGFLIPIFQNYPDSFYSTNQDSTTVKNEYMPRWVKKIPVQMASSKVVNLNGEEKINVREITATQIDFDTFLASPRLVQVNLVYFPGWTAYVNGRKSNIIYDNGFIVLRLDKGKNDVLVRFEETRIRFISDLISILSLFGILILVFNRGKIKI